MMRLKSCGGRSFLSASSPESSAKAASANREMVTAAAFLLMKWWSITWEGYHIQWAN